MNTDTLTLEKGALWMKAYKYRPDSTISLFVGGSSSGKSWEILDSLMFRLCTEHNIVINVVGKNYPALWRGNLRDAIQIWFGNPLYKTSLTMPSRSGIRCEATNSTMCFTAYANEALARQGKHDYLFIDECQQVDKSISEQLIIRCRVHTFVAWNPDTRNYWNERYENDRDAEWCWSDHRANKHLPEIIHNQLERLKDIDVERWRVYARGLEGKVDGLVYSKYDIVDDDDFPETYKWEVVGLDFGFVNDVTALVQVRYSGGDMWLREICYETGLLNGDIAGRLSDAGLKNAEVVADSAELKSIEEIRRNHGVKRIVPAKKGAGSVKAGIDCVQSYRLHVCRGSAHIIDELLHYKWKQDAFGRWTNEPEDRNNHALDAIRYAVTAKVFGGGQHRSSL